MHILIVDDSSLMRMFLKTQLQEIGHHFNIQLAIDGIKALEMIEANQPDCLLLDLEMPGLHGLEVLTRVRKQFPKVRVIVCSAQTQAGAQSTFEALNRGALDCIGKPNLNPNTQVTWDAFREEIREKLGAVQASLDQVGKKRNEPTPQLNQRKVFGIEALAIAASTGGPLAIEAILQDLSDFSAPILIVQHFPTHFTGRFAERLNQVHQGYEVLEAEEGLKLKPRQIVIAQGGYHLQVKKERGHLVLALEQGPKVNQCRPSADVLFKSLADTLGGKCACLVLTGMGSDGLEGAKQIKKAGGIVLAQDLTSSAVWGMPGAVVNQGIVDEVLNLALIGPYLEKNFFLLHD